MRYLRETEMCDEDEIVEFWGCGAVTGHVFNVPFSHVRNVRHIAASLQ